MAATRFRDVWGGKLALAITAVAAILLTGLASPWVKIADVDLAKRVDAGGDGWRAKYGDLICSFPEESKRGCDPEYLGTTEAVQVVQLSSIALIVVLGVLARKRQPRAITIIRDAAVMATAIGLVVFGLRYVWATLGAADALIATGVI